MNFSLYAGDGAWLLVPDCTTATQAAIKKHGPLEPIYEVGAERIDAVELKKVMAWIDVELYAEISEETARRLLEERPASCG